jgi:cytoskeletal protein RodZ
MNELGDILKNARLKKGMTLDDLQEITKIRTRYLKAIEDGDFNVIPALVYAKGFVKSYAEAVGLDAGELLKKYSYLFEEPKEKDDVVQHVNAPVEKESSFDLSALLKRLIKPFIGVLVVCLFAFGIYYMINQINKGLAPLPSTEKSTNNATNKSQNQNKDNTTSNDVYSNNQKTTTFNLVNSTKSEFDYKVSPVADSYKVDLSIPGEKCWVSVKVDGVNTYQYLMTSGMVKTFDVKNDIEILMGNPPDAKITVDGKEIPHIDIPAPVTVKLEK